MKTIDKINNLFIKGMIDKEEYEELISKYERKPEPLENIRDILGVMSVEELLETYKNAITETEAKRELLKYLIISELENRINK